MAWALHAVARGFFSGANQHENPERPRSFEKRFRVTSVGARHADCEQGDCSIRSIKERRYGEPAVKGELKVDACIICARKVQPTENWLGCVPHEVAWMSYHRSSKGIAPLFSLIERLLYFRLYQLCAFGLIKWFFFGSTQLLGIFEGTRNSVG